LRERCCAALGHELDTKPPAQAGNVVGGGRRTGLKSMVVMSGNDVVSRLTRGDEQGC
jgi:hypothetical protein